MNVFTVVILVARLITAVAYIMTDDLADGRRKSSDETERMGGIVGGDPAVVQRRDRFCRRRGDPCRRAPREAVSDAVDGSVIVVAPGGGSRYASVSFLPNIC